MKSPGVTTSVNGKNKTLYMQTVKSIEERTRANLKKTLKGMRVKSMEERKLKILKGCLLAHLSTKCSW